MYLMGGGREPGANRARTDLATPPRKKTAMTFTLPTDIHQRPVAVIGAGWWSRRYPSAWS
ncbi:hypothetical protein SNOUR_40035 [Streptomyces noursei ATCC 11455]|nr:hypothetical protein SNOUR_40035 [Streptomyces noursei ATCC 11455]